MRRRRDRTCVAAAVLWGSSRLRRLALQEQPVGDPGCALDGTLSVVGYPSEIQLQIMNLTFGRKQLTSPGTGEREARPRC